MSSLYSTISISEIDEGLKTWLLTCGIEPSSIENRSGRYPTLKEIRAVIENLEGYEVEYFTNEQHWYFTITNIQRPRQGPSAMLVVTVPLDEDLENKEDNTCTFHFEQSWPELMIPVLKMLAKTCGSFVLVPHSGATPLLIMSDTDDQEILKNWIA